jgi:hypothetical protein
LTVLLKSAERLAMTPETWLPTADLHGRHGRERAGGGDGGGHVAAVDDFGLVLCFVLVASLARGQERENEEQCGGFTARVHGRGV